MNDFVDTIVFNLEANGYIARSTFTKECDCEKHKIMVYIKETVSQFKTLCVISIQVPLLHSIKNIIKINIYYKCDCPLEQLPYSLWSLPGELFKVKTYNVDNFDLNEVLYYLNIVKLNITKS